MKIVSENGTLRPYHNCVMTYNYNDINTVLIKSIGKTDGKTDGVHPVKKRPVAIFRVNKWKYNQRPSN